MNRSEEFEMRPEYASGPGRRFVARDERESRPDVARYVP